VRQRLLPWLAGITGDILQDMHTRTGMVIDESHTTAVTISRAEFITAIRQDVPSGKDIATRSRWQSEPEVARVLERCSAEEGEQGLALSLG